jgi:hypothetical protein
MNQRILSFADKEFSCNKEKIQEFLTSFEKNIVARRETYLSPKISNTKQFFTKKKNYQAMTLDQSAEKEGLQGKNANSKETEKYNFLFRS